LEETLEIGRRAAIQRDKMQAVSNQQSAISLQQKQKQKEYM